MVNNNERMSVSEYYWVREDDGGLVSAALRESAFTEKDLTAELKEMSKFGSVKRILAEGVQIGAKLRDAAHGSKVDELQAENSKLRDELNLSANAITTLQASFDRVFLQRDEVQRENKKLMCDINCVRSALQRENAALREQLKDGGQPELMKTLRAENTGLRSTVAVTETLLTHSKEQLKELGEKIGSLQRTNKALEETVIAAEEQRDIFKRKLDDFKEASRILESSNRNLRDELDRAGKVISENGARIFTLESEAMRLRGELHNAQHKPNTPKGRLITYEEMDRAHAEAMKDAETKRRLGELLKATEPESVESIVGKMKAQQAADVANSCSPEQPQKQRSEPTPGEVLAREAREAHQNRPPVKPRVKQLCMTCGQEIGWVEEGQRWIHLHSLPRHPAVPEDSSTPTPDQEKMGANPCPASWDEKLDALWALVSELTANMLMQVPPGASNAIVELRSKVQAAFKKP